MSDSTTAPITKVGIISCSGEEIAEGTISRLATRRVLESLRPDATVTLCLPLFLAGNEGERNFARTHPTITIDGCEKQCAKWGTEKHGGPVAGALVVSDILGTGAVGCSRSSRSRGEADNEAVRAVAERIAAAVDQVLNQTATEAVTVETASSEPIEAAGEPVCACMQPLRSGRIHLKGKDIDVAGLPIVFNQGAGRGLPADAGSAPALLEMVKIYHYVAPEEEADYKAAVLEAYRDFLAG